MIWTVVIIVFLLAANGFFVAAEFSLVKVRAFRLQSMAADGRFGAALAEHMRSDVERYLAACQLGITMASLGLGWVGEPAVAMILEPLFHLFELPLQTVHTVSFLLGFILFSSLHIVIGEQVPKTWAIRKAENMVRWCAHPLYLFYLMAYPLNWSLNKAASSILALFRIAPGTHADVFTDREIQGIIESSSEHGTMEQNKAEMLTNLLAFDECTVGRVMIPRSQVSLLDLAATPEENMAVLRDSQHSRFPVINGRIEFPVGILLAREVYRAMLFDKQDPFVRLESFCRKPPVVPESLRVAVLFETMRAERAHMALVVDEYGQFIGLVTLEDLLEEIVGEISDETDASTDRHVITETGDGWVTDGLTPLSDVERATGLAVPDELNVNTLSGLLMHRLGRMPAAGDRHVEGRYEVEVRAVHSHRVAEVLIRDLGTPPTEAGEGQV